MPIEDKTGKGLTIQLPSLVGVQEFTPSGLMIKTLCAHLQAAESDKIKSAIQILSSLGSSKQNWYNWQKKEGFTQWWKKACSDFHANIGLVNVHNAIYRRALSNSPQDAKIYVERFDDEYKPTIKTEHGLDEPGSRAVLDAIARSRARAVQGRVIDDSPAQGKAGPNTEPRPDKDND